MTHTDWPAPVRVPLTDATLSVHCAGPEGSAAPPVVLLHGFPEIAFSWRHQVRALAAAGLRVIVPDQRGYGASERPAAVEAYDMVALTGDVVELLDHFGHEKGIIVGHDWGGLVAWAMATRHPNRVAGVVGLNTPYTKRAPQDPIALYRRRFGEEFYIVQFQEPDVPESWLEADIERTVRSFLRRPGAAGGPAALSMRAQLAAYDPSMADPHALLTPAEQQIYVDAFTASGFRGPVNWYRNFSRNWALSEGIADHVSAPALMITAELDPFLPPSAADGMEKFVPDLEKVLIPACGHWSQQERPEAVNAALLTWIHKRFGPIGATS